MLVHKIQISLLPLCIRQNLQHDNFVYAVFIVTQKTSVSKKPKISAWQT